MASLPTRIIAKNLVNVYVWDCGLYEKAMNDNLNVSLPNNWNSLPLHIRSSDSLATFQSRLKSHLFASAYHV